MLGSETKEVRHNCITADPESTRFLRKVVKMPGSGVRPLSKACIYAMSLACLLAAD
jgi:hypothetical protein